MKRSADVNAYKESDLLTTAAKAIGTTLGKIAVKAGIATPPAAPAKVLGKAAAKKKTPATKVAAGAKRKTASRKSPRKTTPLAKVKQPARRSKKG